MGLRLERNAQAPDRSDKMTAHNYILGRNSARHPRLVAEQKRAATDVALNLAVDLDLAFRGDVASDRQVLADNRRDHLARTWAGALGSIGCRPLGEGRLRIADAPTQFGDFLARLGLRREHTGTLHRKPEMQRPDRRQVRNLRHAKPLTGIVRGSPSRANTSAPTPAEENIASPCSPQPRTSKAPMSSRSWKKWF